MTEYPKMESPSCPVPLRYKDHIVMGHGSGGLMMHRLIKEIFLPSLGNPILNMGNDAGVIISTIQENHPRYSLVVSTDSHVVWPLTFPGGDIGRLSVCGTVNDVSMLGGIPQYLTVGFILEEGLDIHLLEKIVNSMHDAAEEAGIQIVAGDTKVVEKGKGDGIYISTSGFGYKQYHGVVSGSNAQPGDIVIVSGTLGDHGIAVLVARGELGIVTNVQSDIAPLNHIVKSILEVSDNIHVLRDPTRGGLATTLNEIATQSQVCINLFEGTIPVKPEVAGVCEMLGYDPLYVANEGKFIAIVSKNDAQKVLEVIQSSKYGRNAVIIGEVTESPSGRVLMKTPYGSTRIIDVLSGEMLPRIC